MFDPLSVSAEALRDPFVLDWVVDRWDDARKSKSGMADVLEKAWFTQEMLSWWLEHGDARDLSRLFRALPPERFEGLGPAIAARWAQWPESLAALAAQALARQAPDAAARLFEACLEEEPDRWTPKARAAAVTLPALPPNLSRALLPMAAELAARLAAGGETEGNVFTSAIAAAATMAPGEVRSLAKELCGESWTPEDSCEDLSELADSVLHAEGLFSLLVQMRQRDIEHTLTHLAPFFDPAAPLSQIDRVARAEEPWDEVLDLLQQAAGRSSAAAAAQEVLLGAGRQQDRIVHGFLACFGLAAAARAWEVDALDAGRLELRDVLDLLCSVLHPLPHLEALAVRLADFSRQAVAEALLKALPAHRETEGGAHIAAVMGILGWEEFLPALVAALNPESDDWAAGEAYEALARIGPPAQAFLLERWDELDETQQHEGRFAVARVGGPPAAELALTLFPELFRVDMEGWCHIALSEPDARLLALLAPELRRKQPPIDETYLKICLLLGEKPPGLAEVRERVAQERARLAALQETGIGADTPLWLPLRCELCGDENRYEVGRVVVGEGAPGIAIAGEFPCASCGEWPEFEVETMGQIAVSGELLRAIAVKKSGAPVTSRVQALTTVLEGREVPIPSALRRLRELADKDPRNGPVWLQIAQIEYALDRPRRALTAANGALALEPLAAEAALVKAKALRELGQAADAFALLRGFRAATEGWRLYGGAEGFLRFQEEFSEVYNGLLESFGASGELALSVPFLKGPTSDQPSRPVPGLKVGRNDPCPCGSGRKYKKCCGR